jgi:hypothetical protein
MRKLIVLSSQLNVRDFLAAGAFDGLEDEETFFTGGADVLSDELTRRPTYVGAYEMPKTRREAYRKIRRLLLTSYRHRSRTARVKLQETPFVDRTVQKLAALPGLRQLKIRAQLKRTGLNPGLHKIIESVRPDLVIVPSSGVDPVVVDVVRSTRELGIPSLALIYNWDNLSSKAAFVVEPDYLGVGGHQAADHAERIHRIPRKRIAVLGSPYIDLHFSHPPGSTASPFPFPYVLFAGCYQPFDELTALELLEEEIERSGLDLKVVYLPHPRRLQRDHDDFVDDARFKHVVVEPRTREAYVSERGTSKGRRQPLPLDYYPALLENAEFVVCPLSTLMLEAAIFRRTVLVIAYHDGVHASSPGVAIKYLHFDGVDRVDTFEVCREMEDLAPLFSRLGRETPPPARPPKEQMDHYVYHDERPYSERLRELVEEIGRARGLDGRAAAPDDSPSGRGARQEAARPAPRA